MNKTAEIIFLFFFLLFLQVFILNKILFLGYINPYLYIAFVFLYPLKENKTSLLISAFLLGLCVDFFSNSGGIHAFATVFIAYIRSYLIHPIFRKSPADYPFFNLRLEPFGKVFNYVSILTIIHHFLLFSLANFSFQNYVNVLINTLFSSIFTLILFFLGDYIFRPKKVS
ncbi:rod shape-determining protein MreD [Tenacibaculum sp. UWU-22]|uniref:rod shape-determining protein MreD n=1 Tax=Tenacibaculum sp. UWU-22 TaxID=3234187 RepID=UPI0034DB6E02